MIFFPLSKGNSGIYHSLKTTGQSYWHFNLNRRCCHIHTCVCVCVCMHAHVHTHVCISKPIPGKHSTHHISEIMEREYPFSACGIIGAVCGSEIFFTAFLEWNLTSLFFFFFFPSLISSLLFYSKSDIKPITIVK